MSAPKKTKQSAGLLLYRRSKEGQSPGAIEVFLVHPGGPFWQKKDDGAWSNPKGEFTADEDPLAAAKREFAEETGAATALAGAAFRALAPIRQPGGKVVHAWAVTLAVGADLDPDTARSNTFALEWPPRSGKMREFPEIDRAAWFPLDLARRKILKGQLPLLDQLVAILGPESPPD